MQAGGSCVSERHTRWLLVLLLMAQVLLLTGQVRKPGGEGSYLEKGVVLALAPVASLVATTLDGVRGLGEGIRLNSTLKAENKQLREELDGLRELKIRDFGLQRDMDRISEALRYVRVAGVPLQPAEELPLMLVAFCKQNMGKQVGNGECWTLANEAFRSCGLARPGGDNRVWGRLLDLKQEKLAPGDIVEYRNAKFSNGSSTGPAHTSVVVKGGRRGSATIAEQNWSGHKTVREAPFDSRTLIEGEVMVYRPNYSKTQN